LIVFPSGKIALIANIDFKRLAYNSRSNTVSEPQTIIGIMKLHWKILPSFASFFRRSIANFINKRKLLVSDPEKKRRLAICRNCPHKIGQPPMEQCDHCLCVLEIKTMFRDEQCADRLNPRW